MAWVYILRCGDNTFYVGHTSDLKMRLQWHQSGLGASHTSVRLPVDLVYSEEHQSLQTARTRERQIERWSGQKKAALASGDVQHLKSTREAKTTKDKAINAGRTARR